MSTLERAIFVQECDELASAADPQYEPDSDANSDGDVDLRGDEAEEKTEDVAEREESIFERKEESSVVRKTLSARRSKAPFHLRRSC